MSASQSKPPVQVYVYPSELRYVKPLEVIASYVKEKSREGRPSRHHIARLFDPLEEFLAGSSGKADTLGRIMDLFTRHYGFAGEDEAKKVLNATVELLDWIAIQKSKDPVGAFKMLRNMRTLLIGMVTGQLAWVSFEGYERKSQKEVEGSCLKP